MPIRISKRLRLFFEDYIAQLIIVTATILLTLVGVLPSVQKGKLSWVLSTDYGFLFIIGSLFLFTGTIISIRQAPGKRKLINQIQKLQEELDAQTTLYTEEIKEKTYRHLKILRDELRVLFEILKFTNNERISLYKHDGKTFNMLARYSSNPKHKKTGRGIYPTDQGCIGSAWENKEAYDNNLGDDDATYFNNQNKIWNITFEVARSLTMKSKNIGAFAIDDTEEGRIAVIVFESTDPDTFNWDDIKTKMREGGEEKRIEFILKRIGPIEPEFTYALTEGF